MEKNVELTELSLSWKLQKLKNMRKTWKPKITIKTDFFFIWYKNVLYNINTNLKFKNFKYYYINSSVVSFRVVNAI